MRRLVSRRLANCSRMGVAEMGAVISLCLVIRVEAEITAVQQCAGVCFSGGGVGGDVVSRNRSGLGYDSSWTKCSLRTVRRELKVQMSSE